MQGEGLAKYALNSGVAINQPQSNNFRNQKKELHSNYKT